jgi:inhibitor of cysteine peptidase
VVTTQSRIFWLLICAGVVVIGAIMAVALMHDESLPASGGAINKFESTEALKAFLKEHRGESSGYSYYQNDRTMVPTMMMTDAKELQGNGGMAGSAISMPSVSVEDYSATNIQVIGVDEADFVKNDGKYIYLISDGALVIIDAYPAAQARIVSTTPITGESPAEIFLKGDRLVVFANGDDEIFIKPAGSVAPVPYWRRLTKALVFDISDRNAPDLLRTISMTGSYYNSRMIGDYVYTITTEPVDYYNDDPFVPVVKESNDKEITPDLYYFDMPYPYYLYQTITSFNIRDDTPMAAESFLVGPATTLYSSPSNMYLAYQRTSPTSRWNDINPALPDQVASPEYNQEGTIIHKFSMKNGKVRYVASGDVPGHLLNQFSMDEFEDHLRVATTVEGWTGSRTYLFNNVYVLDDAMQTVGRIEYIAPDERIYSSRFIGDRLYLVTFKRVDPFFVIDLSDPAKPGILGMLKIPGFSDYLHPYDKNHIIGIGRETAENQWGGVSTQGLKLALFDVSDVNNPAMIDKVEIGVAGTDSEALRDHKAFLFDRSKNLLVIPVEEVRNVSLSEGKTVPYTMQYWNGAYVFGVTPETGFVLRGKVAHGTGQDMFYGADRVTRSLYMGDVLSTISSSEVILSDLDNPGIQLGNIPLPYPVYRWNHPIME